MDKPIYYLCLGAFAALVGYLVYVVAKWWRLHKDVKIKPMPEPDKPVERVKAMPMTEEGKNGRRPAKPRKPRAKKVTK